MTQCLVQGTPAIYQLPQPWSYAEECKVTIICPVLSAHPWTYPWCSYCAVLHSQQRHSSVHLGQPPQLLPLQPSSGFVAAGKGQHLKVSYIPCSGQETDRLTPVGREFDMYAGMVPMLALYRSSSTGIHTYMSVCGCGAEVSKLPGCRCAALPCSLCQI